jgi:lipid A 3-O-deacylase
MCKLNKSCVALVCFCSVTTLSCAAESAALGLLDTGQSASLAPTKPTLWDGGIGEGFLSSVQTISLEAGAVKGVAVLGGRQSHDLALVSLSYGHMLSHTVAKDHFYRGNWELRFELFGGSQFAPTSDWVIGIAPHLRYDFATGSRFIPYIDFGAGVAATSISPPDLSNTFEFNLQATAGTYWFLRDNLALNLDVRYFHMSCAGISSPNLGLNGIMGMIGLAFFF